MTLNVAMTVLSYIEKGDEIALQRGRSIHGAFPGSNTSKVGAEPEKYQAAHDAHGESFNEASEPTESIATSDCPGSPCKDLDF